MSGCAKRFDRLAALAAAGLGLGGSLAVDGAVKLALAWRRVEVWICASGASWLGRPCALLAGALAQGGAQLLRAFELGDGLPGCIHLSVVPTLAPWAGRALVLSSRSMPRSKASIQEGVGST